ncbi:MULTISPECIES: hypothetical protein [unclassified Butyrivibrio]|uniref:hypothetical protein n=1 Tax=unclassified Butyrivibrio TaxID=2639466 RepID=UPI0003B74A61|nr:MULTISPECIES: hypothetical protein [unclassified Butyrivibrio]SEK78822.1 hypothetical protein SAMN04487770_10320 [Butyrivibrio sp. ob235]
MYIAMHCINANNSELDEICKFYGIHYDNMYKSCVISTDHQHHDFVVSMLEEDYKDFYRQVLTALAAEGGQVMEITKGKVFRCRKNEIRHGENQKCEIKRL